MRRTTRRAVGTESLRIAVPILCSSCDAVLADPPESDAWEPLCPECRSPLRFLAFPELYCDLGEGD